MQEDRVYQVGLIGGSKSGKTTMLLALEQYTRQYIDKHGKWTYQGLNSPTITWLDENREDYLKKGVFPPASSPITINLKFLLFRRCNDIKDDRKVLIETQERPGYDFEGVDEEMLEYLTHCDGLIFLFGVKTEGENLNSDMIRRLLTFIDLKRGGGEATGKPLPQRVAVCISQYDDPELFKWLRGKNYLEKITVHGVKDTPWLNASKVANTIREWYPDGQAILDEFGTRFNPGMVNFYAISSIGFWKEPGADRINWEHCNNVALTPTGGRIRNAPDYRPVNLLSPLAWILDNKESEWQGR